MLIASHLTTEGFARYGRVFIAPATGRRAAVPFLHNDRPRAVTTLGLNHLPVGEPVVSALERHRLSAQCFVPMAGGRLLLVVAPHDTQGQPAMAQAEAFIAAPLQAFEYNPGVWHAGLAAIDIPTVVAALLCRDGSSDDVEVVNLPTPLHVEVARLI